MSEQFTRTELYDLVWANPMSRIAARFGMSDVALKKHCARALIPVPPRGHWAKLLAGKRTFRPKLPDRPAGMDEIAIGARHYPYARWSESEILGPLPDPPTFD